MIEFSSRDQSGKAKEFASLDDFLEKSQGMLKRKRKDIRLDRVFNMANFKGFVGHLDCCFLLAT